MELWTKASYIEEIKEALKRRYISLKYKIKKDGNLRVSRKQSVIRFVKEMTDHANQHYYGVKNLIERATKDDRVDKQIELTMTSIKSYKEKIYNLCNYDYR